MWTSRSYMSKHLTFHKQIEFDLDCLFPPTCHVIIIVKHWARVFEDCGTRGQTNRVLGTLKIRCVQLWGHLIRDRKWKEELINLPSKQFFENDQSQNLLGKVSNSNKPSKYIQSLFICDYRSYEMHSDGSFVSARQSYGSTNLVACCFHCF
ncbi:unnamed protein product [Malus baccata var. baccata]